MQPVEHLYAQPLPKRQRQLHHRHSNSSQDRINVGQGFLPRIQPAKHHNRQASYVKMKIWFDVQAIITNCDFYSHRSRPRRPEQLSNLWIQGKRNDHRCLQLQRFAIKISHFWNFDIFFLFMKHGKLAIGNLIRVGNTGNDHEFFAYLRAIFFM